MNMNKATISPLYTTITTTIRYTVTVSCLTHLYVVIDLSDQILIAFLGLCQGCTALLSNRGEAMLLQDTWLTAHPYWSCGHIALGRPTVLFTQLYLEYISSA